MIGEFRASVDGIKKSQDKMVWMFWSYLLLDQNHQPAATHQLERLFSQERYHGASMMEWLSFVSEGFDSLAQRLELLDQYHEARRIESPRECAASFLAAWLWQCMLNKHERYRDADLHVSLGLGHGRALVMEWDFRARPMGRHIQIVQGSLDVGQFNTHAALSGFPGLPEHCAWPPSLREVEEDL